MIQYPQLGRGWGRLVIYVDVLVALNFILTYLMLLTAAVVLRVTPSPLRLLLGSLFGGIASLTVLLPDWGMFFSIIGKISVCAAVTWITFCIGSLRFFVKCCAVCMAVSLFLAGAVLLLEFVFGAQNIYMKNGAIYFDLSFIVLVATAAVCFLVVSFVLKHTAVGRPEDTILTMKVFAEGDSFSVPVLYDSGNQLRDTVFGTPAAIVSLDVVEAFVPSALLPFFTGEVAALQTDGIWQGRLRILPSSTINGDELLPCFRCDKVLLETDSDTYAAYGILIAVTQRKFADNEYRGLVGPGLLNDKIKGDKRDV